MRSSRIRCSTVSLVLTLAVLLSTVLTLRAQENLSKIRRIYVPADAPEIWPPGDWTPIPAERLARAESQTSADEMLPDSWIQRARYAATFRNGTLEDGRFGIEIKTSAHIQREHTSLLSWENSNVAFTNLQWEDQPAQLGTSLEKKTLLLVPNGQRQLSGEWSLRGRPLADGFQFRLQLPPAAITELTLTLPPSSVFKTFDQTQWEWLGPPTPTGRSVRLSLGSRTSVNFAVLQFNPSEPTVTQPSVFAHDVKTLVVLSRDQSRIRQELRIEALEAPLSSAMFTLPPGVVIREVELGGRPLEDWSIGGDRNQFLKINFPEAITGLSRPLRLTGLLDHPPSDLWRLPRILPHSSIPRPQQVPLPEHAPLYERVTINVTPPLELLTLNERGYRQTAATTTTSGSGSLVFESIAPEGFIDIRIGLPPNKLRTEIATRISTENHRLTASCELAGKVSSGRLYVFSLELAPEWNPTSIKLKLDPESEWFSGAHWWISDKDGQRLLNVELPQAISRDQSLQLQMNLQQFLSDTRPALFPVVRTQREIPCDQLLVLERDQMTPERRATVQSKWSEIEFEDSPAWFNQTDMSEALLLGGGEWSLFSARSPDFLQIPNNSRISRFSVRSEDRILVKQTEAETETLELSESLSFQLDGISAPLPALNFSTSSGASLNLWNWNVVDRPEIEIQCRRRSKQGGEAEELQYWELAFVPPLSDAAVITSQSTSPTRLDRSAVLPFVQNAHQHAGRVVVDNQLPDSALMMTSTSLEQSVPRTLASAQHFESGYAHSGASLNLQLREDQPASPRIETSLRWETTFHSSDSDQLLHNLKLELPAGITQLTGSWPATLAAPTAWVNDVPVIVVLDESGEFEINWDASGGSATLEVEFLSPILWNRSEYRWSIPLPQFDLDVRNCVWSVQLPEGCRISGYSEPLSLIQSCVSAPVHWSRRFFGPLGRQSQRELFEPLDVDEWRSLIESAPVGLEPRPGDQAPADAEEQAACRFRLSNWPQKVDLAGWSESRQERYAWVFYLLVLIGGVLIRIARWETSPKFAAWFLSLSGLIAWTVPDSVSLFTGAFFAAVLTSTLIPRVLLLGRRSASREAELPFIEGSTLKGMVARLMLCGAILGAAQQMAAQSTNSTETRKPAFTSASTIDVLIPFTGSEPPVELPGFVYIRESDRKLLIFQEIASKRPVLFTSAIYDCRLSESETPTIRVRLQVEIPAHREVPLLTLPLSGANLAREGACYVDGEVSPIAMTSEGLLEISLPERVPADSTDPSAPLRAPHPASMDGQKTQESYTVNIELNLYPPVAVQGTVQQWELQIPSISNSRFRCVYPQAVWPAPRVAGSQGEVHHVQDGLITADLGKSTRISCQWSNTRFPETDDRKSAQIEVLPIASIKLLPTHLKYRIQTRNTMKAGQADYLRWHVPVNFHLHKVISDDVVLQTREVVTAEGKQITFDLIETLTPESGSRIIEAEFIVPFQTGQDEEIAVVIPDLLDSKNDDFSGLEVIGSDTTVGLWSPPELPLNVLELPASGVRTLTDEDWNKAWPEDASLPVSERVPVPDRVYGLQTPATLTFLRTSTQPQRVADLVHETGTIGDQYLDWEWNADVKTTRLPAFQHQFQIDPRLEILSVSVQETQAERVHRWSREGSRLTVRLTSKTTEDNSQNVTIRGRVPLQAEQELELPEIRLVSVDQADSRVELYLSPHRTARWLSDDVKPAVSASASTALNRGDLTLFDNFTRRDNDVSQRTLIIDRKIPPPHVERNTTVRRRSDGDFDITVLLTEQSSSMHDEPLQIIIPQEWLARLRPLRSVGEVDPGLEPLPEGGALLSIPPESRSQPLILQTTLSSPKKTAWTVPWPGLKEEATSYHNLISLRLSDGWAPRIDCRIDPADESQSSDHSTNADRWVYLCDTLELQRTEISDPGAVPTVLQLVATVELQPGAAPRGQWWILYRGRGKNSITLESPVAIGNVTAEINSQTVEPEYDEDSRFLTIPLLPGEAWQSCLVNWTSETPFRESVISEFQLQMPKVSDLTVRESQVILVTHPDLKLTLHHELKPESAPQFRLNLLETILEPLQSGELRAADLPEGISLLLVALLSPAEDSDRTNGQSSDAESPLLDKRLKELRERLPAELDETLEAARLDSSETAEMSQWESLLPGVLAHSRRPDREMIYFSIPETPKNGKVWWMSRQLYRAGIAVLISLALIPISLKLIQDRTANWAVRHRPLVWLTIGVIWWTCLQLSAVGLFIVIAAIIAQFWTSVSTQSSRA